ncbi:MAG: hypothetical protein OXL40_00970 [Bacteroidota bacterium]|nr:hypothetical protein [Bacteroidota bacterium]
MTVNTQHPTDLRPDKVKLASKDDAQKPKANMTQELGLTVCPISERIIKETSVKWRRAMEMLADL